MFALALGFGAAAAAWGAAKMDGPFGMIPGGAFRGADSACRPDWTAFADLTELELELRPSDPRSITIWSVVLDGTLYLPADFLTPIKRWPYQLMDDPRVRLRAGGGIDRCEAVPVTDEDRISALRAAIAAKYAIEPDGWAAGTEVWWFRIRPRGSAS